MLKNALTIDPGMHTGWAYWHTRTQLPATGQFFCCDKHLPSYVEFMCQHLDILLDRRSPTCVYIEGAEVWGDSLKSITSAKRGDIFKLAYLIGAYVKTASDYCKVEIVTARAWKGQMTKAATQARVKRILGVEYQSEHVSDAVAFGLSFDPEVWNLQRGFNDVPVSRRSSVHA